MEMNLFLLLENISKIEDIKKIAEKINKALIKTIVKIIKILLLVLQ